MLHRACSRYEGKMFLLYRSLERTYQVSPCTAMPCDAMQCNAMHQYNSQLHEL